MRKLTYLYTPIIGLSLLLSACSKKNTNDNNGGGNNGGNGQNPTAPSIYVAGTSYKTYVGTSNNDLAVEYIAGDNNSKLILSAPHGGDKKPTYVRTRTEDYSYGTLPADPYNSDKTFSDDADSRTRELALAMADSIKKKTGFRPHVIINHLHRSKLDANRRIEVAAQGDTYAQKAWRAYMDYVDSAKKTIKYYNNSGLLIDVHGNAHDPQRTEVGYLIDKDDFTSYKNSLNTLLYKTSIQAMVTSDVTLESLIKGDYALGTLIYEKSDPKIKITPSKSYPEPANTTYFGDGKYFNGGYITARFGSRVKEENKVSSIQLEFNSDVRSATTTTRNKYAGQIADALKVYMDKYFK